jgi:hypothetical protein
MSHPARLEYLKAILERYRNAARAEKGRILDEYCLVCGFTRKYAIRLLSRGLLPAAQARGRPPKYPRHVLIPLVYELWLRMGKINSKRIREALPEWLPFWEDPRLTPQIKAWLLAMSAATLDRLLSAARSRTRGMSSTRPNKRFLKSIPLQPKDWNVTEPGFIQADTVAHTHTTLEGVFANTLTVTDIHTGWTENRSVWGKSQERIVEGMHDIEEALPFALKSFKSDSGSEFLNGKLFSYLTKREVPVLMVRSRPYRKNDNCYVEQKNFTHVRELFGYVKIDRFEMIEWMNRIYRELWNPLNNFFLPSMKLLRKERIGSRIKKHFDSPKTPYQRVMESPTVPEDQKQALREAKDSLNPFALSEQLERELKLFLRANRSYENRAA